MNNGVSRFANLINYSYLYTDLIVTVMKSFKFFAFAMVLLLALACNNSGKVVLPQLEPFVYETDEEGSYSVRISYQRIVNTEDNDIFAKIERQNYINSFFNDSDECDDVVIDLEATAKSIADEYASYAYEYGPVCWYSMDQTSFFVRDNTVLCYETLIESYTGGAHGGSSLWYECFDLATGAIYDFSYLYDGEWGSAMKELVYAKLIADKVLLIESVEELPPFRSATLTDSGVVIIYQPYEVACFAAGIISVEVTDEEIVATGAPLLWE